MMRPLAFLVSIFIPLAASAATSGYDIVIVAGQSNAVGVGCGPFTDVPRAYDRQIDMIYPDGQLARAVEPLAHAPGHGSTAGKGFAMTFARLYAAQLPQGRRVLLVPVALGGTSILQWDEQVDPNLDFATPTRGGDPLPSDSRELFDTLIRQTRLALRAGGPTRQNRIAALLWHQGETDLLLMSLRDDPIHAAMPDVLTYGQKFADLVQRIRASFAGANFPVVAGELGRFFEPAFPGPNGLAAFNAQLAQTTNSLKQTALVSSEGLGNGIEAHCAFWPIPEIPEGDPVHFNAAAQVEFGCRYFEAFRNLKPSQMRSPPSPIERKTNLVRRVR